MALDPLIKEETPPAPPAAPDPMAAVNAELATLRAQIDNAYKASKNIQPAVQYVPYVVPQPAAPEPQLTEAEYLADIPNAVRMEAQRIAAEREAALREELGGHLGVIYERQFEKDVKELSAHPYYKAVEEDLQKFIAENPNVKFEPGRLTSKFHELVGAQAVNRPIQEAEHVERVRAVEAALPTTTSPLPTSSTRKEPVKLDESREAIRQWFNQNMQTNISPEEWVGIEQGGLLDGLKD